MRVPTTTLTSPGADAPPFVRALTIAQRTVKERYLHVEVEAQPIEERDGERDLGYED